MNTGRTPLPSPSASSSPLVELRHYTLQPGQRNLLIELFRTRADRDARRAALPFAELWTLPSSEPPSG
jgi:hypothetical protein